jgi:hypothetical protein
MTRPYTVSRDVRARQLAKAREYYALYQTGMTLQQIGDRYGLTRERIRQVMTKHLGVKSGDGGQHVVAEVRKQARLEARDRRYLAKSGYTFAEYWSTPKAVRTAYNMQRKNAVQRGIAWEMNLRQWWEFWQASGYWPQRGRGHGYCMCRKGDEGPYSLDNVFIASARYNSATTKQKKSGLPAGVRKVQKGDYIAYVAVASFGGKQRYLGSFKTPESAGTAYLQAIAGFSEVAA